MTRQASLLMAALVMASMMPSLGLVQEQQLVQEDGVKAPRAALPTELLATTQDQENSQSVSSVLLTLKNALNTQLHAQHGQWFNALVALAFGVVLVVDGEFMFKCLVVGGAGIVATLLAHSETADGIGIERFWCVGFGAFCACVTYLGMEGMLVLLGAAGGIWIAAWTQTKIVKMGCLVLHTNAWLVLTWYSLIVLSCVALAATGKRAWLLGIISPFLGGALVSSALSFFVTNAAVHGWMHFAHNYIQPVGGAWVDFLFLLLNSDAQDVGIFTGLPAASKTWPVDRIVGCVFWSILFVVGYFLQKKLERKVVKQKSVSKSRVAAAREPLLSEPFTCA